MFRLQPGIDKDVCFKNLYDGIENANKQTQRVGANLVAACCVQETSAVQQQAGALAGVASKSILPKTLVATLQGLATLVASAGMEVSANQRRVKSAGVGAAGGAHAGNHRRRDGLGVRGLDSPFLSSPAGTLRALVMIMGPD